MHKPIVAAIAGAAIFASTPALAADVFNEGVSGDVDAAKLDAQGNLTPFILASGVSTFSGSLNSGAADSTDSYLFQVVNGQTYTNFALAVSGVQIASGSAVNLFQSATGTPVISNQAFFSFSRPLNLAPGFYTLVLGDGVIVGNYSLSVTAAGPNVTAAVPEPSTWLMMLLGFGSLGLALRRRRRLGHALANA